MSRAELDMPDVQRNLEKYKYIYFVKVRAHKKLFALVSNPVTYIICLFVSLWVVCCLILHVKV
jgi:hypothetical protein